MVGVGVRSLGVGSGVDGGVGFLVSASFCGKGLVGVASELFSSVIFGVDLIGGGVEVLLDGKSLSGEEEVANLTGIFLW